MTQSTDTALGTEKISSLMLRLCVPAVAAQLVNVLYNVVDRIYIGQGVGPLALTGLGVCMPILLLISAFSSFAGMGGAPLAAIRLGAGDKDGAEKILGNSTTMLLFLSVVLTAVFQIFKTPLLYAFGASDSLVGYAGDYITVYLWGTVFVQLSLGLNTFISAQGNAKTAMYSVLLGAGVNIVLDPIFIFGFGMGVRGAALATIISQGCSAVWVVAYLTGHKTVLRLRRCNMRPHARTIGKIAALGISPFIMQSTESLVSITMNTGLQRYGGDLYVGSMTVLQSVMQMLVMPIQGFAQGVQPIISYNYGARQPARVKEAFRKMLRISFGLTCVISLLCLFIPGVFARMFTEDAQLIALVKKVMPLFMAGMWAFGAQMACQTTFMGLGQAKISLFLALLRKVILLIPLALVLPKVTQNVMGIYAAEPIADIVAAGVTLTAFILSSKKLLAVPENSVQ